MSEIFRLSPTKLKAVTPMIPARHGLPMIEKSDGSKIKAIINAEGGLLYLTAYNIPIEMQSPRFDKKRDNLSNETIPPIDAASSFVVSIGNAAASFLRFLIEPAELW